MILSLCTISFRHQLISIDQLAKWAQANHFQGIELWGIHAKNLASQPHYNKNWLAEFDLKATMLSDYLPLQASESELKEQVELFCRLAKHWGSKKVRTFAGKQGSADTTQADFIQLANRLKKVCDWMTPHGLSLIIETHPNTYADTVTSTEQLFEQVARDNLKLNFDVLHVWESKAQIIPAFERLKPVINHFHLKNISSAKLLDVFSPSTVYSASGSRKGIVPLFDGAVNYAEFLDYVNTHPDENVRDMEASLEWFGDQCKTVLNRDRYLIQRLQQTNEHAKRFVG
ncbi:sugar phosphate isomerase/epimerase family protein [Catenovulum adriaticum]|uniref:Sugar phosphate isomerase/epimerase n=1 Tax=Catenovulum adriaticum TaxID=2984846 RepID=A0ABY7AHU7_9ALTE|nr:sugar phosphate isomerase/epimerase [Catenovulum sp. TS8]WAJ69187.1 sugar phosphate isomerase/epimerase [Catenovulum sp. TS8]